MGRATLNFSAAFHALTGNSPFPWQEELYKRFDTELPSSCNIPTGLGKTAVLAIWLIALANRSASAPRRLVYVVNRRTVVDQTSDEAENLRTRLKEPEEFPEHAEVLREIRRKLSALCSDASDCPLAISTLRGQFADNREWSADPARPAIIVGTVDMIGSRLLFSGYGIGFKTKPLHAGFLGQDSLVVHDESHLEPAFQELLGAIECEQRGGRLADKGTCIDRGHRRRDFRPMRVMELTATSRGASKPFELTAEDYRHDIVKQRIRADKAIEFISIKDEKKELTEKIVELARAHEGQARAVIIFVRRVEDVDRVTAKLPKERWKQLTGTMRGLERETLIETNVFKRFLSSSNHEQSNKPTEYLVCTSAGEVGVNLSADDLICDLSTYESMAQRFGRVNRFGRCKGTTIKIVHPVKLDVSNVVGERRMRTLALLQSLNGDGSPAALSELARQRYEDVINAFSPPPTILPASDILFDAWALTTVREKLPGRPIVEPYLHGISEWQPPETRVAWREEVGVINTAELRELYPPEDLLEDYPLKPHELLRDNSNRVFDRLRKFRNQETTPAWIVSNDDVIRVTMLAGLIEEGKEAIEGKIILLPPAAGGIENGVLTPVSLFAEDVADKWPDEEHRPRRSRTTWDEHEKPIGMRLVRTIDTNPGNLDEDEATDLASRRFWHWYVRPRSADDDGSKSGVWAISLDGHNNDVVEQIRNIANRLFADAPAFHEALISSAAWHDLGKDRAIWQRSIGNEQYPHRVFAKSGRQKNGRELKPLELTTYRHEFGSLVDVVGSVERMTKLESLGEFADLVLHLIVAHHGYGRPHFPEARDFDWEPKEQDLEKLAIEVPIRFARLQRKYGRWGLAYLESLLRAADWAASADPAEAREFAEKVGLS